MMRVAAILQSINPELYNTNITDEGALRDMISWRNTLRNRFTDKSVTAQMKASDVFKWAAGGSNTGYGFVVKDITNNTALYVLTGQSNTSSSQDLDDVLGGSGTDFRAHVVDVGITTDGSTYPLAGVVFIFNPDTTISEADLDFDDTTELTYVGGDDTALSTINPDSLAGLAALRPSHAFKGFSFEECFASAANIHVAFNVCYDDELKTWLVLAGYYNGSGEQGYLAMMGDWIAPGPGDTDPYGHLKLQYNTASTVYRDIEFAKVEAKDAGGTTRTYDLLPLNNYTNDTYKVQVGADAGKVDWKLVSITNGSGGSGTKGTTDNQACVEIYPFNDARFHHRAVQMNDDAHPIVKMTDALGFFWEGDYPLPFSYAIGDPA